MAFPFLAVMIRHLTGPQIEPIPARPERRPHAGVRHRAAVTRHVNKFRVGE